MEQTGTESVEFGRGEVMSQGEEVSIEKLLTLGNDIKNQPPQPPLFAGELIDVVFRGETPQEQSLRAQGDKPFKLQLNQRKSLQ